MAYLPLESPVSEAHRFTVCMGWDAMRICMGLRPKNYSLYDVAHWFALMAERLSKEPPT